MVNTIHTLMNYFEFPTQNARIEFFLARFARNEIKYEQFYIWQFPEFCIWNRMNRSDHALVSKKFCYVQKKKERKKERKKHFSPTNFIADKKVYRLMDLLFNRLICTFWVKGCGMGTLFIFLVSPCFRKNVVVTCKIESFLCSLDNLLQKNVIVFFFGN